MGDAWFGAVAMNPDFAVFDGDIGYAGKGAIAPLPTQSQQLVTVALLVIDGVGFEVAAALAVLVVIVEDLLHQLRIVHFVISSCRASITINRMR